MAGELEGVVRQMFDGLDKGDTTVAVSTVSSQSQGIDEISRRWIRGQGEVTAYAKQMMEMVSDVHSELMDVHETVWGDVGVVTCWLEQDYTMEGDRAHVSAPTTIVLRREADGWKIVVFHSLPLPDQS